jgi:hypothetical protein
VVVHVVENTPDNLYLTLPARPRGELSERELEQLAGGSATPHIDWEIRTNL